MALSISYAALAAETTEEPFPIMASFTAQDLSGNDVTEAIFKDHPITLVNVWGTYCNPCISEMPDLKKLSDAYAEQGFQVLGIVIDIQDNSLAVDLQKLSLANEIIDKTGANYLHIVPSIDLYYTFLSQVTAIPLSFFADENGNLIGKASYGSKSYEDWEAQLLALAPLEKQ